ncbi:hypothetical protein [Bosea sp. ASV33]|uniref:hypothetical protein n=1 Tax=Bosea sp. ASV33 TaxID=2795106 RepID=UPI0018EB66BB|nr:hypothetical protein [Bosea sp. ASV33]
MDLSLGILINLGFAQIFSSIRNGSCRAIGAAGEPWLWLGIGTDSLIEVCNVRIGHGEGLLRLIGMQEDLHVFDVAEDSDQACEGLVATQNLAWLGDLYLGVAAPLPAARWRP